MSLALSLAVSIYRITLFNLERLPTTLFRLQERQKRLSEVRRLWCVISSVIGRCFSGTRPTILIGRQCPFVRAKVDPGASLWACRQATRRRTISCSDWWKPAPWLGARSVGRKSGAAAVSWSESRGLRRPPHLAPFPAPQTQDNSSNRVHLRAASLLPKMMNADMDESIQGGFPSVAVWQVQLSVRLP
ncbi:hypothetical protein LEMLEM_LOCUS15029 [Lemmus lemmus]